MPSREALGELGGVIGARIVPPLPVRLELIFGGIVDRKLLERPSSQGFPVEFDRALEADVFRFQEIPTDQVGTDKVRLGRGGGRGREQGTEQGGECEHGDVVSPPAGTHAPAYRMPSLAGLPEGRSSFPCRAWRAILGSPGREPWAD